MLWEAERKKSQFPKGRGFSMKMSSTEDWLKKNKRVYLMWLAKKEYQNMTLEL